MCTGEYAKHPGSQTFRILFVDDHNSCRSQMAEAIALGLKQPKFIFSSAGIEPKPIDAATLEFMKTKGFDLSRKAPKALNQIPNFDYYQVIVILSKEAYQIYSKITQKIIILDWIIDNPSQMEGPQEKVQAAYEETFQFIQRQVHDLIEAIIGNNIE
jgi:protein-tyrosine-phosphatase